MYAVEVDDEIFDDEAVLARSTLHTLFVMKSKPTEVTLSSIRTLARAAQPSLGAKLAGNSVRFNARANAWLALCYIAKAIDQRSDAALDPLILRAIDYVRVWLGLCGRRQPSRSDAM
jgi:hypothetical protein